MDEIFSTFGKIKDIDFGNDKGKPWINKGMNFIFIYFRKHLSLLNSRMFPNVLNTSGVYILHKIYFFPAAKFLIISPPSFFQQGWG